MVTTRVVELTELAPRGRFAVDAPVGARLVSAFAAERPSLLVRLWFELPSSEEVVATTDAAGLLVVRYVLHRVDLRRRRFVLDGRGTTELSVRELRA